MIFLFFAAGITGLLIARATRYVFPLRISTDLIRLGQFFGSGVSGGLNGCSIRWLREDYPPDFEGKDDNLFLNKQLGNTSATAKFGGPPQEPRGMHLSPASIPYLVIAKGLT